MKTFDIEVLKKDPKTKLVIQHYQKEVPTLWLVHKWEIVMEQQVVIKMPTTGYETADIILADSSNEIRDIDNNLVGTLFIADEDDLARVSLDELGKIIYNLKIGESIAFDCNEDSNGWCATKIEIFDGPVILIGYCGGGSTSCLDIQMDNSEEDVINFTKTALEDDTTDLVYINPINNID